MEDLFVDDETQRKIAVNQLYDNLTKKPENADSQYPDLLGYIQKSDDTFVRMRIASALKDVNEKNPKPSLKHNRDILATINDLQKHDLDSDQSYDTSAAVQLLTILQPQFTSDQKFMEEAIPTLFSLMQKKSAVKWSAYNPVVHYILQKPLIFKNHVEQIIDIATDFNELLMTLSQLHGMNPAAFSNRVDTLVKIYQKNSNIKGSIASIFMEIAKEDSSKLVPHVNVFKDDLTSPTSAVQIAMIYAEIARNNPEILYPLISDLCTATKMSPGLKALVPNILGLIGRHSEDYAKEVLVELDRLLEFANQDTLPLILTEFRNIAEMNKDLISEYIEKVRQWENDPQETIRDQITKIIDIYEGRDMSWIINKIEEQNLKIKEIVKSLDDLREYVDENIDLLKDFISEIAKKLPVPVEFSTDGRIRKTLILSFVCGSQSPTCLYPQSRMFQTESKAWNKWMKIAFSAVKLGKSVLLPPNPGDAISSIKKAYEDFKTGDQQNFVEFISEPFLTSNEQDELIEQLKKANFFSVFHYDASKADWTCIMCNPPSL